MSCIGKVIQGQLIGGNASSEIVAWLFREADVDWMSRESKIADDRMNARG